MAERKDRWNFSISVGLLIQNGVCKFGPVGNFDYGIILVQKRDSGLWGLPAGGVSIGEDQSQAAIRELQEETAIESKNVTELEEFNYLFIPGQEKTSVGFILRGMLKQPIPIEGYEVGGAEVSFVKPHTRSDLVRLLEEEDKLYRPEFNEHAIRKWLDFIRSPYEV